MTAADANPDPGQEEPAPYCRGTWRQQVLVLGVTAALVLGFALNMHFSRGSRLRVGPAEVLAAVPVAQTLPATNEAAAFDRSPASDVQQVGTGLRTDFNRAALVIRPATLAVRATFGTGVPGESGERVGSAVVVDASGYAVTCQHVVVGATTIAVRRYQQPTNWLQARAVATEDDLALLAVLDNSPFTTATFADSDRVQVGDWVLAAGHPFQLGLTVTAGIVSRRGTTLTLSGGRRISDLLQIDAAINEGSSGGPLVNVQGELVGINTAIYAPSGVFSGAGFAIPSNRVRAFVSKFLGPKNPAPEPKTSWGVGLSELTPELALELSYPNSFGVVVGSVAPNSAAETALLARGDVIVAIAGVQVRDMASARRIREQVANDNAVAIEIWRQGTRRVVTLRLGAG